MLVWILAAIAIGICVLVWASFGWVLSLAMACVFIVIAVVSIVLNRACALIESQRNQIARLENDLQRLWDAHSELRSKFTELDEKLFGHDE